MIETKEKEILLNFINHGCLNEETVIECMLDDARAADIFNDLVMSEKPKINDYVTKETVPICDVVGVADDISSLKRDQKWKDYLMNSIKNDTGLKQNNVKQWISYINSGDPRSVFYNDLINSGRMELFKLDNKYYLKDGSHRISFAKIIGMDIPYFESRIVYDCDRFLQEN